jgi:glucokinase
VRYESDKRTVLTLDAGGTKLAFSAIRGNRQVLDVITLSTHGDDLERCLSAIVDGFQIVRSKLEEQPVAISFAFPGPADYPNGIIGDLPNLPAFRGGVALGPALSDKFGLPVFINNDGDLFAYGEAIAGYLPLVNSLLQEAGSPKRYKNLLGLTIGTGFGAGIVRDGALFLGDNSGAGEIWLMRNKLMPTTNIEEHASIRGVRRCYAREAKVSFDESPSPKEIYEITLGTRAGNRSAALKAFQEMGEATGDAIANAITLIDGLVVIGGGLSGASEVFLPHVVREMNSDYTSPEGLKFKRLVSNVYNLENPEEMRWFLSGSAREISVFGTNKTVSYDPEARIGIGATKLGTSRAILIGAYAFALHALDAQSKAE